ncbi:virion core protein [Squirrelpox virus]|uniref:Assembly protein G7 n=1 Tax=Squirrelpox virus TaxID=240426 RepID=U3UBH0_9POXV|nr:virion core protein [Squirrelpox virus]CCD83234.1 virion core protein [Squirrelpox virus]
MVVVDQRQSTLFAIVSRAIVRSVLRNLVADTSYVEGKARMFCYCGSTQKREALSNSIYARCEADLVLESPQRLLRVLDGLRAHSAYVCDASEFWRLHGSLMRFTHCGSFFRVCQPTVNTALATLVTLILVNKLMYAAEMVEGVEGYLFDVQKSPSQDVADLLEMKYGLVNMVQYRLLPAMLGESEDTRAGGSGVFGSDSSEEYMREAERLLSLPVRTTIVSDAYRFLIQRGVSPANNSAEYAAGLKIEELPAEAATNALAKLPTRVAIDQGSAEQAADRVSRAVTEVERATDKARAIATAVDDVRRILTRSDKKDKRNLEANAKLLDDARKYATGHVLDGAVTSPITPVNNIQLTESDMQRFAILEYLYVIRVMASCVKRKNSADPKRPCGGTTLNINSPFKIITVPGRS